MPDPENNNLQLHKQFLEGLEASNDSSLQYEVSDTVSDRILLAIRQTPLAVNYSIQPALAAWAGVGIVVAACVFLSKQPLPGQEPSKGDGITDLVQRTGSHPSNGQEIGNSNKEEIVTASQGGASTYTKGQRTGVIAASDPLDKTEIKEGNIPASKFVKVEPVPHYRQNETFSSSRRVLPGSAVQAPRSGVASHQPPEEGDHSTAPRSESTPSQKKRVIVRNNRLNPSQGETMTLSIRMEEPGRLTILIHNRQGELVTTITDQDLARGTHEFTWGGTSSQGQVLSSGIYFISIQTPSFRTEEKALILK